MPTRIICAAINKVDWFALGDGSVSLERPYYNQRSSSSHDYILNSVDRLQAFRLHDDWKPRSVRLRRMTGNY